MSRGRPRKTNKLTNAERCRRSHKKRKEEDHLDVNNNEDPQLIIMSYFTRIHAIFLSSNVVDTFFREHMKNNLLCVDEKEHIPAPVFSYIIPTMGMLFILHVILSIGRFETEIDLNLHESIREFLRYCHLIGTENNEESLNEYVNILMRQFIIEKIQYFLNTQRVIDYWIIVLMELLTRIIMHNEISICDMLPVQL